ncbi:MAG: type II toxin-antitoxin system PemK/MazF family toxin [Candidatus Rokubacteria bacterium]|nr:type II toxin-antitoxin system PemK/MazF family toxin [Candidatus Rokubacteria bacterium]
MRRGEVWLAALDPVRGSEQAGTRPVLVLQVDPLNDFLRTIVIVPFTTNVRWARFPFCVPVAAGDGGLAADSVALCHQIRVSDRSRVRQRLGQVSEATIARVARAVHATLGT